MAILLIEIISHFLLKGRITGNIILEDCTNFQSIDTRREKVWNELIASAR
jgi:hypothetical protein